MALDPAAASTMVPLSPAWSVRDVVAHVTGIAADFVNQNLEGIGADAWTAAQVDQRAARSLSSICDEWRDLGPAVDALTASDNTIGVRMTADLVSHVHDIGCALGRNLDRETDAVRMGLERYGSFFCERAAAAGLGVVRVVSGERDWQSAPGAVVATVEGSAFELLRAFSGRRTAAQVRSMNWTGDATAYLAVVSPYGLPDSDVVE